MKWVKNLRNKFNGVFDIALDSSAQTIKIINSSDTVLPVDIQEATIKNTVNETSAFKYNIQIKPKTLKAIPRYKKSFIGLLEMNKAGDLCYFSHVESYIYYCREQERKLYLTYKNTLEKAYKDIAYWELCTKIITAGGIVAFIVNCILMDELIYG